MFTVSNTILSYSKKPTYYKNLLSLNIKTGSHLEKSEKKVRGSRAACTFA